eukprot:CAMPEP_0115832282 /NCGR_PEP_ID=MMETSP0287-20121206/2576_1 /TAXON_ID=412157 /ORGANISM="Chrysochromulina rotalis, Strain UIO044" /LENGTH=338 /DNA_ID=CAMNT_0003285659 /DNA_START=117 /DNA_END=1133 /DNA_ORIENTATION=-
MALSMMLSPAFTSGMVNHVEEWSNFKTTFGKTYTVEEEATRFETFMANLKLIEDENRAQGKAVKGITKFMDMTPEEFKAVHLKKFAAPMSEKLSKWDGTCTSCVRYPQMAQLLKDPPAAFDWTEHGAVTPVKDQGQCGSCWSFGTTGDIEGVWFLANNSLTSLSEQQLVSCDTQDSGCNGGLQETAFNYVIRYGLTTESNYPYTSGSGRVATCDSTKVSDMAARISDWVQVSKKALGKSPDEGAILTALLASGPITIGIDASPMQFYRGGVDSPQKCGDSQLSLDHAVTIVGYGNEGGVDYWKIKNSWNTDWGEQGYYRIVRGENKCGVASDAVHSVA